MFRKLSLCLTGICLPLFLLKSFGQTTSAWHLQPVQMKTRWAAQVNPNHTLQEYPRPQQVRSNWTNLNGLWQYAIVKKDTTAPKQYDGQILVPYPVESALSGVKQPLLPDQELWYQKLFPAKQNQNERLLLHFGAVDFKATVYINDQEIGTHTGGYTAFTMDITKYITEGNNEIKVKVWDPTNQGYGPHGKQTLNPANIYYTASSGIWQTVWLEKVPTTYIDDLGITPNLDQNTVFVTPQINTNDTINKVEVLVKANGKTVQRSTGLVNQQQAIRLTNVHTWSPDDPYLYDLTVRILRHGKVIDEVQSYFGMRKISIAKDEQGIDRIFLNNKPYYNLGTLDQGFWPDGLYTAPTDEALKFDVQAIKAMGFNTIRKHIKVEPARWYYYADKLGMLVWQDMVNPNQGLPEGSKAEFEKESKEILEQLYNYPSITTWVLFNERWGAYDQERLTQWLKTTDPTRLVNGHTGEYLYVNGKLRKPSPNPYVASDITDVHSYPNPMLPLKQPGRAMVCGEFGGIGVSVPYHEWNDITSWGYISVLPSALQKQYSILVDSLIQLQRLGLSGSIYTQPFDVEGEENGLMTYDREMVKIPVTVLRALHAKLIPRNQKSLDQKFNIGRNIDTADNDNRYPELIEQFTSGNRDSAFLRRLTLIAIRKKDQPTATKVGNTFIEQLHQIHTKENINFIESITRTSADTGFQLYLSYGNQIDAIMGRNAAINKVRKIIEAEEVTPYLKIRSEPAWEIIKANLQAKYDTLGLMKYYGDRMIDAFKKERWDDFCIFYPLYFNNWYAKSEYHINNMCWAAYEHCSDPATLAIAAKAMKYNIEIVDPNAIEPLDTYANILFKLGRKKEAIEWEALAARRAPTQKIYRETLEKMKSTSPSY